MICSAIVIISIVSIIIYSKIKKNKFVKSPDVRHEISLLEEFLNSINDARSGYFRNRQKEIIKNYYSGLYEKFSSRKYRHVSGIDKVAAFLNVYRNLDKFVEEWNSNYVSNELATHLRFFEDIDGKSLDLQQREAVVTDEDNNLILAGAGSGKTLTISAKAKYLVDKKNINPEEILLISFTRKAAEEMQERISNRLKIDVTVKTFHKLGMDIISEHLQERPDVSEDLNSIINEYLSKEISKDESLIKSIIDYFGYYINLPSDFEEYDNIGEVIEKNKNSDLETIKYKISAKTKGMKHSKITIKDEKVKSIEEVIIANFLYLNGVKYSYEKEYPHSTGDIYRKKYRPDFYLEDYDIYLEHFGINEDWKVPWLSEIEGKKYLEGIEWKRKLHLEKGTKLIETYSYYNRNGSLLIELDKLLKKHKVVYKEVDYREIYKKLFINRKDRYFNEFKILIETFIGLFKSRGYSEESFDNLKSIAAKNKNIFMRQRSQLFLSIVQPIFVRYSNYLKESGKIDFNDMINMATEIIRNDSVPVSYKYIIVDEYQDISVSRFNLIKEIKNKTNAIIMAVGDDWQSIYRFTGSDIDLFTNFKKYFGYSKILKIEKTYRNSQELINIAGKFITKNPKQMKKNLVSDKHKADPIRIFRYNEDIFPSLKKAFDEIIDTHGQNSEILILGRTKYDKKFFIEHSDFIIKSNKKIVYREYPDLKITFLTVHSSKGLEADNVIIINLENKLLGFPNKISDDPVLSLVLTDLDEFDFAEERRLFYVGLTRTKNISYLIVNDYRPSIFADELIDTLKIKFSLATNEKTIKNNPRCPFCQKGYMVARLNNENDNEFLGCSNYPLCQKTINDVNILNDFTYCIKCGGYMVKRNGKYGKFYSCINFPSCKYSKNISKQ